MSISMDDVIAIASAVGGAIGAGIGVVSHRKVRKAKNDMRDLDRKTREQVIRLEEKVKGISISFDRNMEGFKEDLKYIRDSVDRLKEKG